MRVLFLLSLTFACTVSSALPAGPPIESNSLNSATRKAAVEWIAQQLGETYIFLETAQEMANYLRSRLEQGAYDELTSLQDFSEALTEDLQSISSDKHLRVRYAPDPTPDELEKEEDRQRMQEERLKQIRRDNFAFRQAELLAGNVGYLKFDAFMDAGVAGPTAVAALNFLGNCDALIIDLTDNGGGNPSMIQVISSYFFDAPQHLNSFYIRKEDKTQQFWTSAHVEGPKLLDTDLYILTSSRTFSAAEEFTYNLKNMQRATIVGEVTGGGAHPVDFHRNADLKLGISLPFGRAINPISGTNWEGTGVQPDVVTTGEEAREVAYVLALRNLRGKAEGEREKELDWLLSYHESRSKGQNFDEEAAARYVGQYGPRKVTFNKGDLYYQREGGAIYRLFPIGEGFFGLDGFAEFRIRFEEDASGHVIAIQGHYRGTQQDRSERSR